MQKNLIDKFSEECDKVCFSKDEHEIDKLLSQMHNYENKYSQDKTGIAHILFCIGNLYTEKAKLKNEKITDWRIGCLPENLVNSLNYFRKAAAVVNDNSYPNNKYEIQTNIANSLSHFCRAIEAIELYTFEYDQDKKYDAYFVAPFSKAKTLTWLAPILNDPSHSDYYYYEAYQIYKKLIKNAHKITYSELKDELVNSSHIKNIIDLGDKNASKLKTFKQLSANNRFRSKKEFLYRKWCADNCLFLNPMNDLTKELFVTHDILQFPDYMVDNIEEGPYFPSAFSDIKNKYCKARYLFYSGLFESYPKWLEQGLYLTDTLDYVDFSTGTEMLKIAQKQCFSVLDSLTKLLVKYFKIKSQKNTYFKPDWFVKNLSNIDNCFIDALFYLSCDLSNFKQANNNIEIIPHADYLKDFRNNYEHNWVRIAAEKRYPLRNQINDYATIKTREDLEKDVLKSFKIARSAMLYFTFAVSDNERKNCKNDRMVVNIQTPIYIPW